MKLQKCLLLAFLVLNGFSQPSISFLEEKEAEGVILSICANGDIKNPKVRNARVNDNSYKCFKGKSLEQSVQFFKRGVETFSNGEKIVIKSYVDLLDSLLSSEFPVLAKGPWRFILVSDSLKVFLPDTRAGHIIVSRKFVKKMKSWRQNKSSNFFKGLEIMVNDKVRILQKTNPAPFEQFYQDVWGFIKLKSAPSRKILRECLPSTPLSPQWIMKIDTEQKFILPALIPKTNSNVSKGSLKPVGIVMDSTAEGYFPKMNDNGEFEYRDLNTLSEYRDLFPLSEYNSHPHELSADLLSKYLVKKLVSSRYGTASVKDGDYSHIGRLIQCFRR